MTDMSAHVTSQHADIRPAHAGGNLRLLAMVLLVWAMLAAIAWFAPYMASVIEKAAPPPAHVQRARPAPVQQAAPAPAAAPAPRPRPIRRAAERAGIPLDAPHETPAVEEFDVLSASELAAISQDRSTAP